MPLELPQGQGDVLTALIAEAVRLPPRPFGPLWRGCGSVPLGTPWLAFGSRLAPRGAASGSQRRRRLADRSVVSGGGCAPRETWRDPQGSRGSPEGASRSRTPTTQQPNPPGTRPRRHYRRGRPFWPWGSRGRGKRPPGPVDGESDSQPGATRKVRIKRRSADQDGKGRPRQIQGSLVRSMGEPSVNPGTPERSESRGDLPTKTETDQPETPERSEERAMGSTKKVRSQPLRCCRRRSERRASPGGRRSGRRRSPPSRPGRCGRACRG